MTQTKDLQSNVITFLRFPLIMGVLFIHNYSSTPTIPGAEFGIGENIPIFYACSELFSQVLGSISVPLFFFISGFLFFQNIDGFTKYDYTRKLKRRGKTLLIPYLFWNITVLLTYCIAQSIPALNAWFNNKIDYNLQYLLQTMWSMDNGYPIAYQFWFIRDLMAAVILTPVIYFFVRKAKVYGVLLLGVLWYFGWWLGGFIIDCGLSIVAVFFFSAGAWFGINKRNFIDDIGKVRYWSFILYPLLALADLLTKRYAVNIFIHNAGIIIGIVFWVNFVAYLLRTGKTGVNRFLASASFFVFAIHDPLMLRESKKILYALFNPQSDL
ncbi:MAG: acyltransferase, partial [Prevotellaceae bacterium]|nr:acyltransferase [Prevotellaceae bacterium]